MTKEELEKLNNIENEKSQLVTVGDLPFTIKNQTLLYGYTCSRETFHVYIKNGQIHVVVYETAYSDDTARPINMREIKVEINKDYVPDKRVYPERSNYYFCSLLMQKDVDIHFTSWTEDSEPKPYYGFTLEDAIPDSNKKHSEFLEKYPHLKYAL